MNNLHEILNSLFVNCCIHTSDKIFCKKCCECDIKYIHIIHDEYIHLCENCFINSNGSIRCTHIHIFQSVQNLIRYVETYYPECIKNQDIKIALK
jgi:hypothetical protein